MPVAHQCETPAASLTRVLLVEDNPGDARLTKEMLAEAGTRRFNHTHVERLGEALVQLHERPFDVILLDLSLPDAWGLDSISQVRAASPNIPLVVLSSLADESLAIQALRHGAQDYLVKGEGNGHLLTRSIRYAIERKQAEDRLAHFASCDQLTGLANRSLLQDRLVRALARGQRQDQPVYVLYLDLDGFKEANDTFGHDMGDRLLKAVAERLTACLRTVDTVARVGGDEFIAVLECVRRADDALVIAVKLLEAIAQPYCLEGHEMFVTASIGLAAFPYDGSDVETLLRCADVAMYQAKSQGGNDVKVYTAATGHQNSGRMALSTDLRRALAKEEFFLYYQPQMDLITGETIGVEALIRWRHPEHGLLTPASFIPLAEENGLIVQIGKRVLHLACAQYRAWLDKGLLPERAAVNLSPRQFRERDLMEIIDQAFAASGLPPQHLELEVTENFLLGNPQEGIRTLTELKARGLHISLDDFGTGYSSLRYLKILPLDRLKIDQSFIGGLSTVPKDDAIVTTIITLARTLGLQVTAEGVETLDQMAFLGANGCDAVQGYLVSPPLSAEAMTEWLREKHPSPMVDRRPGNWKWSATTRKRQAKILSPRC